VVTPTERENLRGADLQALLAAAVDRSSLEEMLPGIQMPCLLYAGEGDEAICPGAEAASRLIQNASFFSLPGLSHAGAMKRSDLVLPRVVPFLQGAV
jgi:pimeloyl-ACP methyl ester carboxylesterase